MTPTETQSPSLAPAEEPTEAQIHDLVHGFYDAVRADDLIGPVFTAHIADDAWPVHLAKMCDFWSSALLKTKRYDGRPLPPHLALGREVGEAHFARWLSLFAPVARRTLPSEPAERAIAHAARMAHSFRMGMAFHRGEDTTAIRPIAVEA